MKKNIESKPKKDQKKHINIDVSYDANNLDNKTKKAKWHDTIACKADNKGCGGFAYFLGVIGAAIYYISTATGFWMGVLGVLKALVWPAFLVYGLLKLIGM
jgi:hypothetical protein